MLYAIAPKQPKKKKFFWLERRGWQSRDFSVNLIKAASLRYFMVKIISADGTKKDINCIGCALEKGLIKAVGDKIVETKNFSVQPDYEIPIPGFIVISSKRHIVGFADFNKQEEKEFIQLFCQLRRIMNKTLKIRYVNILCAEKTIESKVNPSHFHIALLPNHSWMNGKNYGEILKYARKNMKTKQNLSKVREAALQIKKELTNSK